jgi:predicted membrane-bound spermidine synthase
MPKSVRLNLNLLVTPPRWLFFAIFTLSGFSGLIYESIWSHYLKLFLGHAAYAQSLVLAIFMGGMALGSWIASRYSASWRLPILAYAIVEAVIGVLALLFHGVFESLIHLFYESILPTVGIPELGSFLKWSAAALVILPQSVLLGMTFTLMSAGIIRRYPTTPGGSLAMLYFTNSIGAAIGVLASGFWLIGEVGLPGTIFTAGLLNIGLALVVWVLVKLDPQAQTPPIVATNVGTSDRRLARAFVVAAFITGAASFIYEIAWIRMLSLVLGATTHTFELMLSAFITGLAFGGLWIKRRIDTTASPVRFAGHVQVIMGVLALLTIPVYSMTFDWMASLLEALTPSDSGYVLFALSSHAIGLVIMLPATFCAGMTLPLFTHVLMRQADGESAIGRIYAANTVGAIAGVIFAVHIGLPVLGLKHLIGFGAMLDIALGLFLLARVARAPRLRPVVGVAFVGVGSVVGILSLCQLDPARLSAGVYRYGRLSLSYAPEVVYYKDGKTASVSMLKFEDSRQLISTNGKPDASIQMKPESPRTTDEVTMVMAGALPFVYKPDARVVGNIGMGSGLTTHTILGDQGVERVDTVEIEPAMVEAARGFGARVERAFTDPRSHIYIEDAKTYFSLHNRRYDFIVAEPSNPWVSGVSSLFSEEFYRTVRNYLVDDGLLVQWLQLYEFNNQLIFSVLKALSQHFSDFVIYNTDDMNVLIVARPEGKLPRPSFERVFGGGIRDDLKLVDVNTADDFLARRTGDRRMVQPLFSRYLVPVNSDYYPYLDLNAAKARFRRTQVGLMHAWSIAPLPVLEMLGADPFEPEQITPVALFTRTGGIEVADALRARLMGSKLKGSVAQVPKGLESTATSLKLIGAQCAIQTHETEWLWGWYKVAQSTLPYLGSKRAVAMIRSVATKECLEGQSEVVQRWMRLYLAIAERDGSVMVEVASELLEREKSLRLPHGSYLLGAGILGHVSTGQRQEAIRLWEKHRGWVFEKRRVPDYVDLVVYMALDGRDRLPGPIAASRAVVY